MKQTANDGAMQHEKQRGDMTCDALSLLVCIQGNMSADIGALLNRLCEPDAAIDLEDLTSDEASEI